MRLSNPDFEDNPKAFSSKTNDNRINEHNKYTNPYNNKKHVIVEANQCI